MQARRHFVLKIIAALIFLQAAAQLCLAQQLTLTPYKASGIYGVGERSVGGQASHRALFRLAIMLTPSRKTIRT